MVLGVCAFLLLVRRRYFGRLHFGVTAEHMAFCKVSLQNSGPPSRSHPKAWSPLERPLSFQGVHPRPAQSTGGPVRGLCEHGAGSEASRLRAGRLAEGLGTAARCCGVGFVPSLLCLWHFLALSSRSLLKWFPCEVTLNLFSPVPLPPLNVLLRTDGIFRMSGPLEVTSSFDLELCCIAVFRKSLVVRGAQVWPQQSSESQGSASFP